MARRYTKPYARNQWFVPELNMLRNLWQTDKELAISKLIGRHTKNSITSQARKLGYRARRTRIVWVAAETHILTTTYATSSKEALLARLPRFKWQHIKRKARLLGLPKRTFIRHKQWSTIPVIKELLELRASLGVTRAALAKRSGYAGEYISRIESGGGIPSLQVLINLAAALGQRLTITPTK